LNGIDLKQAITGGNKAVSSLSMPDFCHSFHGFHHTVDSALEILSTLGVPSARVTLRMAGLGMPSRWITDQSPSPGEPISSDMQVALSISGLGFCNNLPVAMWDSGGEREPGTAEILDLLDDPLQKANSWIREGAQLFDISSGNPATCARWIALFGLDPHCWPAEQLHPLALLLPSLQAIAGTERGVRLALDLLLHLPLQEVRARKAYRYLEDHDLSLLGTRASRIGIDYVLSDCMEDMGRFELIIGSVDLNTYCSFQEEAGRELLRQTLRLVVPCYGHYSVSWVVGDPANAPRLGTPRENAVLGINSHLGFRRDVAGQFENRL
jgi:hypothetical protein